MRQIAILLLLFVVFGTAGTNVITEGKSDYVVVEIRIQQGEPVSLDDTLNVIQDVDNILGSYNTELRAVSGNVEASIVLSVMSDDAGSTLLFGSGSLSRGELMPDMWDSPIHEKLFAVSPLLRHFVSLDGIASYRIDAEFEDYVNDFVVVFALYVSGQCDLLNEHVSTIDDLPEMFVPHVLFWMGNCALTDGDFELAVRFLDDVWEIAITNEEPDEFTGVQLNRAWIFAHQGDYEAVSKVLDQLLDRCFEDSCQYIRVFRAQIHALLFKYDDALAEINAAIDIDAQNAELYVIRGQITLLIYEWNKVMADFNHAIELNPDLANAYYFRGILHYTLVNREGAMADFMMYLALVPSGVYAPMAEKYLNDIQRELDALN